ncbi:MAG: glycosyltransferase family 4 protein [Pseudonocardiaceae bacterium]
MITGLDLPADAAGGSIELLYDLYAQPDAPIGGQVFMLAPAGNGCSRPSSGLTLLDVPGKCLVGPPFWRYVTELTTRLTAMINPPGGAVVHLQHLAFGAAPALIDTFPKLRRIALVHGTDLLFAQAHPTQLRVLHRVVDTAAAAIVVPTAAMADRLRRLAPHLDPVRVVHIPWGIPDQLLNAPQPPPRHRADGQLRLLYAGRLTAEKGADGLPAACADMPDVHLSIAAPHPEYTALNDRVNLPAAQVEYLGWLPRPRLWAAFADHDLLIVPSTILEAFCLVAIEAQACGLPVAHQPIPGLREVLARSALPIDFADPTALAAALDQLRTDVTALTELRTAGLRNAARFPLSQTVRRLTELSSQIT